MATRNYKLSEIIKFSKKSHRKAGDGLSSGKYPFFTSSQIQSKWLNEADYKDESIILGTGGLPSIHIAKDFSTSADTFILTSTNPTVSIKYLYFFLSGNIELLEKGFKGAGLKHLSRKYTEKILIPIPVNENYEPDLIEQNRIVLLLEEAQSLKNKRSEANKKMDELISSLFIKMFGDPILNTKKWRVSDIIDLCVDKYGIKAGPFGSALKKDSYTSSGPRVYGQEQVIAGDFSIGDYHISSEKFALMSAYKVEAGDILISLVGTTGKVVVVPSNIEPGIINPRLVRIRIKENIINQAYLINLLKTPSIANFLENFSTGITMGVLNVSALKRLKIPVPPIELQKEFNDLVNYFELQKDKQKRSTQIINELFNSVIARSFN